MKPLFRRRTNSREPSPRQPKTGPGSWRHWPLILGFAGLLFLTFFVPWEVAPEAPPLALTADLDCRPLMTSEPWVEAVAGSLAEWIEDARTVSGNPEIDRERRNHALARTDGAASTVLELVDFLRDHKPLPTTVAEVTVLSCDSTSHLPAIWELRWSETVEHHDSNREVTPWRAVLQVEEIPLLSAAYERYPEGFRITDFDWTSDPTATTETGVASSPNSSSPNPTTQGDTP